MSLINRGWNLIIGTLSRMLRGFEGRNPDALLELEKENLRSLIGQFNEGLVSHAALSERLMTQVKRGTEEQVGLETKVRAHSQAGNRVIAAQHALKLQQVQQRLAEDRAQFEQAEQTFQKLTLTRDAAVANARTKIESVRRQLGELKVTRAVADLEAMAASMVSELGGAGDSLDRLEELVADEHERAASRARVATSTIAASDLVATEAEQAALEELALDQFLSKEQCTSQKGPLPLPDLSGNGST